MSSDGGTIQAIFYANPDQYPPIINSTRLLAQAGYEVNILCADTGKDWGIAYPSAASVRRISTNAHNSWSKYLRFVFQVLRKADGNAALYVGHDMHSLLPARLLATRHRRPLVYHCHDFAESGQRMGLGGRAVSFFEHRFARTANLVIVPDAERAKIVVKELRLTKVPFIVANAPLTTIPITADRSHLAKAIHEKGRQFDQIVFRQGVIGPNHAIEATICSLALWESPNWGFVVMGPGDAAYIETLTKLAEQKGTSNQFVVLPPVSYDQVLQFTAGASIGHGLYEPVNITNLYHTTASNKIMEYMAAGLPLLVSDRPGLRHLVEKYNCGLTADESSPESIARAVNTLLGDPSKARAMGAAGARAFKEELCYERQFAPVLQTFKELMNSSEKEC